MSEIKQRLLGPAVMVLTAAWLAHPAGPAWAESAVVNTLASAGVAAEIAVVRTRELPRLDELILEFRDAPLVFVGETHDQYAHHLIQLRVIELLASHNPERLAVGVEFFEQPAQPHLDRFVTGEIDERELLRQSEYFDRWGYDYALYRPILLFAREHRLPLIALRPAKEIAGKVAEEGLERLSPDQRHQLPDAIPPATERYRQFLEETFQAHGELEDMERFYRIQEIWDAAMAHRIARYLEQRPDHQMIVLVGSGHLVYGDGVPRRAARMLDVNPVVMIPTETLNPELADYLIAVSPLDTPPSPRLGLMVRPDGAGLIISDPEEAQGIQDGDRLISVAGHPVSSLADTRLALFDKAPGDTVPITIERENPEGEPQVVTLEWQLRSN